MSYFNDKNCRRDSGPVVVKQEPGLDKVSDLLKTVKTEGQGDSKENVNPDDMMMTTPELEKVKPASFKRQMEIHAGRLENLEEVIMAKVSLLDTLAEEVSSLRKELEAEREKNRENQEEKFMGCIEKLMEEIVQVNLKVLILEERIEESEKLRFEAVAVPGPGSEAAVPEPSQPHTGSEVTEMTSPLAEKIQTKSLEVAQNQPSLQSEIGHVKTEPVDLDDGLAPPVEAIIEASPPSPLDTPMLNLVKWGYANLDEILPEVEEEPDVMTSETSEFSEERDIAVGNVGQCEKGDEDDSHDPHGKAPTAGRYLPFMCLCNLEFETETGLSDHVNGHILDESNPEMGESPNSQSFNKCTTLEMPTTSSMMSTPSNSKGPSSNIGNSKEEPVAKNEVAEKSNKKKRKHGRNSSRAPSHTSQSPTNSETLQVTDNSNESLPSEIVEHALQLQDEDPKGRPRFNCSCGMSFGSKMSLGRHITGFVKRFPCTFCTAHFSSRIRLTIHVKAKHNGNPDNCKQICAQISCSHCSGMFGTKKEFDDHRPTCPHTSFSI